MAILLCFSSCSNNSSSSSGDSDKDKTDQKIDHSLEEISEELKIEETDSSGNKNFSAEEDNKEGVYIEFAIPKNAAAYEIYIDGIGKVTENYSIGSKTEYDFFYPFLEPGKEYTVRVQFRKTNNTDSSGYEILTPDAIIGYFEITAKAGAQSKGEVFLEDLGKIQVEKNGDFKFTKMPVFHNESLLKDEWVMEIGLCEGVSWMHTDTRYKWCTTIQIPNKEILNTTYNFYTYPRYWGDVTKVDFISYRPSMNYKYGDETYYYQWVSTQPMDTDCTAEDDLWTDIDITKNMAKLKGTWERKGEYDIDNRNGHYFPAHYSYIETLEIDATTVKNYASYAFTKIGGKVTEDDLSLFMGWDLSSDGMMLTRKDEGDEQSLSEYFKDRSHEHWITSEETRECDMHYKLQVFDAEKALRIYEFHDWGEEKDGWYYYQKQ